MKKTKVKESKACRWVCLVTLMTVAYQAPAVADVDHRFSLGASAGLEYDDNISVSEIDAQSQKGDTAAIFDASARWRGKFGNSDQLNAGYVFSQSNKFDLSDFDLQIHGVNLGYEHDFGDAETGVSYNYYFTTLGGEDLLTLQQVAPYVSWSPTRKLKLRAEYAVKDKDLETLDARDAETQSGELSATYFIDKTNTYVAMRARFEDEDAVADEFDFEAVVFKASLKTRLPFGGEKNRLSLSLEHEARDYSAITPTIGEIRSDDRNIFTASWNVPLGDKFFIETKYRHRAYSSNLPTADLSANVASITLGFEL